MTTQKEGLDPVAGLYNRAIVDLKDIYNCGKHEPLPSAESPDERGPKAEECWALFDRLMETYHPLRIDVPMKYPQQHRQRASMLKRGYSRFNGGSHLHKFRCRCKKQS